MEKSILSTFSFVVTGEESGLRLDRILQTRYENYNRTLWQQRIKEGKVLIDGREIKPSQKVRTGQSVEFTFFKKPEPEIDREFSTVYEDESLLVINKPPNLPVHPAGIYHKNTLLTLLKERYGEDFISYFVHRLDRETSGLLLLGKNRDAASTLGRAFRNDDVKKEYNVLVEGKFPDYMDARGHMTSDPNSPVRKKQKFIPEATEQKNTDPDPGKWCRTEFQKLKENRSISLLRATLHTGRMHQIRATLCSLGFPVVGDRLYGVDDTMYLNFINGTETEKDRLLLRMNRSALHCCKLELPHPVTGEPVSFQAEMPEDMRELME